MTLPSQSTVASEEPSVTRVAVDEGMVAAARDVGSIIARHVETTERNRRLAPPVIDALRAAGLFRLFTPRAIASATGAMMGKVAASAGIRYRGPSNGADGTASGSKRNARDTGTKTPFAAMSLLSVPRMPRESHVSMISTSVVRRTTVRKSGPWGVIRGLSPSKTIALISTHRES